MKQPKVLVFDIETSPLEVYVWGTRDQNVALNQIKKDWHVMAFAAKWLGRPNSEMIYRDQRNAKPLDNDKALLQDIWKLLDEADIVVTQNGKKFDSRKLNARFILNGMRPPSRYRHLDTYQILSKVADFTSDKLEYYASKINKKYKKLSHKKYPGQVLWTECLKGNPDAWKHMKTYNIHDVLSTEELYMNVRAWAPESAPKVFNVTDAAKECGTCGHKGQMKEGALRKSKTHYYRQHSCLNCGSWQQGEKVKGDK